MREKTAQEELWEGNFGDNYIERNSSKELLASNIHFFAKILSKITTISTWHSWYGLSAQRISKHDKSVLYS